MASIAARGRRFASGRLGIAATAAALVAILAAPGTGQEASRARPGDLFVASLQGNDVAWFDGATGAYRGAFVEPGSGGLAGATGVAFGPDGHLYVASSQNDRILRFDGTTGEPLGVLVDGGALRTPFSLIFGPAGDLYVSSGTEHRVLRYDAVTGELRGVAAEGGGLEQPIGLAFGPTDGLLYVVNSGGRNILRFDPATGAPEGVFASDSLAFPSDLAFGPDGDLYVTSAASGAVVRFDGRAGTFVETRLRLPGEGGVPVGLAFLDDGSLVVGDFGRNRLYRAGPGGGEPRLVSDEGLQRPENIAVKPRQSAGGARSEPSSLTLRVGPSFQSHVDLLATPFRQHGSGVAVGVEYRRGRLRIELDADVGGTSWALDAEDVGVEDVWNGALRVSYVRAVREGDRTTLRVGGSVAALGLVRRHHYGPTAARELFGDLIVPLSVVGEAATRLDPSTRIEDRAEIGIVSLLFRSSFAGTKGWPDAVVAAPWDVVLVRNRLSLEHALSTRMRLTLGHDLTVYAADRHRRVRLLRQDVSAGIRLMLGRVAP